MSEPQSPDRVVVKTPEGELRLVDRKDLEYGLKRGSFKAPTYQEEQSKLSDVAKEKSYEGFVPGLEAAGAGALRGASVGISDALAAGLADIIGGPEARQRVSEHLSNLKKYQEGASVGGEFAGFLAPLLATAGTSGLVEGGLGAAKLGVEAAPTVAEALGGLTAKSIGKTALKAASAPLRGINAIGEAAEHGLAAALGKGATIAPMAARGATEGALLGAGNAISDQALSQDPELTAEHIMPDILGGALGGLVLGGATGTVLKGAKTLFRDAKPLVNDVLKGAEEETTQESKSFREKTADWLKKQSNESAFKSIEPSKAQFRNVEKYHKGAEVQGERIKSAFEEITGKSFAHADVDTLEETMEGLKKRSGVVFDQAPTELDTLPDHLKPSHNKLVGELNDFIDEIHKKTGQKPLASELRSFVKEFTEGTVEVEGHGDKTTFTNLRKLKNDLDTKAYPGGKAPISPTEAQAAYAKMSNIARDFFEKTADTAEKEAGDLLSPELQKGWQQAKKDYETAKILESAVDNLKAKRGTNRIASLTDYLSTIGAVAAGHPFGGLALGAANKYMREHGNQIASVLLDKAAKVMTVNQAAQAADKEVGASIAAFLSPARAGKALLSAAGPEAVFAGNSTDERQKSFDKFVNTLKDRVSNPSAQFADITQRIGDMADVTPQTASHIVQKRIAAENYLVSKIPRGTVDTSSIFPNKVPTKVSSAEIAKFERVVNVAQHGARALMHELKHNHVSRETVDAIKVMYPAVYASVQSKLMEQASTMQKDLTFEQKGQLSSLFGIPADRLYQPGQMAMLQANFQKQSNKAQGLSPSGKPRKTSGKAFGISKQYMTGIQRIEGGF